MIDAFKNPSNGFMTPPKISVVIPAYNSQRFISRAIQSVVDQDYPNIEILCVDDGSTDDTKKVVTENFPSVIYLHQKNSGPAAARNLGIRRSTGDYIAFLDSDDTWLPDKLSSQMKLVFADPGVKIVHANIKLDINGVVTDNIYPTDHQAGKIFDNLLLQDGSVVCSTLLVKKECIDKVGMFDEELRSSEDVHFFLRLAYYYDFHYVDRVLAIKHHHDANLTHLNNVHFGAGTVVALEKIEQLFPAYSRTKSKVMRRALFLRARMKAIGFSLRGDTKNAVSFLIKAFNYDKTLANFAVVFKQAVKNYLSQAARYVQKRS